MKDAADSAGESTAAALDAAADELYALTPDRFTAARNARAGVSDRAAAASIKALRKPSVAAWAVNLLARGGKLGDALDLAAALREAQDDLDAAELKTLSTQRRALVAALAKHAVDLARSEGVTVSSAARDEVEKTINAAVMDAGAAAAVMTGRLVRTLEATGFDEVDVTDAVAGTTPLPTQRPSRDDLAERRARKAAELAVREAERTASEAARELARAEARSTKAQERAELLHERVDDLRAQLERMLADAEDADSEAHRLDRERADAASAARSAAQAAERARGKREA
ncbi:transposase [Microbacterium rhizomatis]|uniref:Transposase n=1 Tax=Microbacterium rhizomatis TaxID=1631477 RepID=A0A5J5IZQ0_9MICO|nr:transposase [Microbacterium rhizomatis]KAA9107892.1 transposase [Microbacterium rhizomatis]